jgi:chorismate dehydratase
LKKIKVGAVSYLNTKPLLYGMQNPAFLQANELVLDYPAHIADLLKEGSIDVGFVPVALLPQLPGYFIVSDYCIAADYEVASVCLFSEVPLAEIETIYLDYQSRSSVALLKILMKEYWGIEAVLIEAKDESYRTRVHGSTAALVIGDRAFEQRRISNFIYDLATEWRNMTGLPFVFAVWASLKPMSREWIENFNAANALGLQHFDEVAEAQKFSAFDLKKYYRNHIRYVLDNEKKKGMNRFLEMLSL